jgi:putative transposase
MSLHLIAEANDRRALARGVQGLSIRIARAFHRHSGRSGRLFADCYHARALKTPREARRALRHVLLNARVEIARQSLDCFSPADPAPCMGPDSIVS